MCQPTDCPANGSLQIPAFSRPQSPPLRLDRAGRTFSRQQLRTQDAPSLLAPSYPSLPGLFGPQTIVRRERKSGTCARAEEMAAAQDGALEPLWGGRGPRQGVAQRGVWSLSTMGGFCKRGVPQGVRAMACWSSIEVWRGSLQGTAPRGLRGASVPDWGDSLAQARRSSWMGRAFVPVAMEA